MTPGFITDAFGLMLLIGPLRALLRPAVMRRFVGPRPTQRHGYGVYETYNAGFTKSDAGQYRSERQGHEPEFLPPGTVKQPSHPDEPPEIIIE